MKSQLFIVALIIQGKLPAIVPASEREEEEKEDVEEEARKNGGSLADLHL